MTPFSARGPGTSSGGPQTEIAALRAQLDAALDELRQRGEEQRRLERELVDTNRGVVALYADLDDKAERLRRADEAKTRFLSGVSHELRTPLNSILALSRLLLDGTDGSLTEEQARQVEYIHASADNLLGLVNNLLDLSRIEAGRTDVTIRDFALPEVLGRLEGEMQPLMRDKDVVLIFEPPPDAILSSDDEKVAQIVRNFISNAIKYTEHGSITVSASVVGERVRIAVTDTGIGIRSEDLERIFEEFTQVRGPLQSRTKGTGLGLPLSRALATLLGGRVGVESEAGSGSTFWVELPLPAPSRATGSATPQPPGSAVVLVVDDDQVAGYIVREMLGAEGHVAIEATGGLDGLARARSELPDVIVLDLSMPDLDGIDVLQRLKEDGATASTPVIVYSARDLSPGERARLAGQAAAFVTKSGDGSGQLMEAIRVLVGTRGGSAADAAGRATE